MDISLGNISNIQMTKSVRGSIMPSESKIYVKDVKKKNVLLINTSSAN